MQTEKKRLSDRDWPRAIATAMTALAVALLAMSWAQRAKLNEAYARINASVQKAFYET